jgi:hypothetical protein
VTATAGRSFSAASLFGASDADGDAASPAGPAAGGASATGNDDFVFAPGLGQKTAVAFSQGAADKHTA